VKPCSLILFSVTETLRCQFLFLKSIATLVLPCTIDMDTFRFSPLLFWLKFVDVPLASMLMHTGHLHRGAFQVKYKLLFNSQV